MKIAPVKNANAMMIVKPVGSIICSPSEKDLCTVKEFPFQNFKNTIILNKEKK